jgi:hypothetical protein
LFGVVLCNPVGASILFCADSPCADAMPELTSNAAAASSSGTFLIISSLARLPWATRAATSGSWRRQR